MKKKSIVIIILIVLAFLLNVSDKSHLVTEEQIISSKEHPSLKIDDEDNRIIELYKYSIKVTINTVSKYLAEKEFIAIQSEDLSSLSEVQIGELFNYISDTFDIEVVNGEYTDMLEQGKENDDEKQKGIYIQISYVNMEDDFAEIHTGVGYAPLGGEGYKITVKYWDGAWRLVNMEMIWQA